MITKGGEGQEHGEPGTVVGGDLDGVPATAEWYYRMFGVTTGTYNIIKYGVILYALTKVIK